MSQSKHTIKNLFTSSSLRIASASLIFVSTLATTGATEASMRESGNIIQAGIWGLTCAEPVDQIKGWCHCDGKK
jgi:hypothetical protein